MHNIPFLRLQLATITTTTTTTSSIIYKLRKFAGNKHLRLQKKMIKRRMKMRMKRKEEKMKKKRKRWIFTVIASFQIRSNGTFALRVCVFQFRTALELGTYIYCRYCYFNEFSSFFLL